MNVLGFCMVIGSVIDEFNRSKKLNYVLVL